MSQQPHNSQPHNAQQPIAANQQQTYAPFQTADHTSYNSPYNPYPYTYPATPHTQYPAPYYGANPYNHHAPTSYTANPPVKPVVDGTNPSVAPSFPAHYAYPVPATYKPVDQPAPLPYAYPSPVSPSPAYPTPAPSYMPVPQPPYPYPYVVLPPTKAPEPERYNEISSRGYKESLDYPLPQARKERRIARAAFFPVIVLLILFFFTPLVNFILPDTIGLFGASIFTFAFEIVLIVAFSLVLRNSFPKKLKDTFGLKMPSGKQILIGVGGAFVMLTAAFFGAAIVVLLGGDFTENSRMDDYASLPYWQLLIEMLVFTPILAPLFEELLFRGILVGSAVRAFPGKVGFFVAIIVTGIVFGSLHFPGTFDIVGAYVVILISCSGMFLAWLRLKTNSIFVTMTTHAVYNGLIVALQFLAGVFTPDMFALL